MGEFFAQRFRSGRCPITMSDPVSRHGSSHKSHCLAGVAETLRIVLRSPTPIQGSRLSEPRYPGLPFESDGQANHTRTRGITKVGDIPPAKVAAGFRESQTTDEKQKTEPSRIPREDGV